MQIEKIIRCGFYDSFLPTTISTATLLVLVCGSFITPNLAYAQIGSQIGLPPFTSVIPPVLPTYNIQIIPGASSPSSPFHYYPPNVAIPAGTTISWSNDDPDQPHTVTSGFPGSNNAGALFNSGIIPYQGLFTYTFNQPGNYPYFCTIHPWRAGVITVNSAVNYGNNFQLRTGTGPVFDLRQDDRSVFDFKPTTIAQPKDTPLAYNVSLFTPNNTRVFSHSFYALNNDLLVELIQNKNATIPANQTAIVYGPDITDPITGTYHVSGLLFNQDGNYTIRAEITAIGNQLPSQRLMDEFNFNVVGSTVRSNITAVSTTTAINSTVGKSFNVTLESNPSTGYQWQVTGIGDASIVKFIKSTYVPPQSGLIGAPGKQILTFQALKQGNTTINLNYFRPWEPWNVADSQIIDLTVG